jgi:hypothetical protein
MVHEVEKKLQQSEQDIRNKYQTRRMNDITSSKSDSYS